MKCPKCESPVDLFFYDRETQDAGGIACISCDWRIYSQIIEYGVREAREKAEEEYTEQLIGLPSDADELPEYLRDVDFHTLPEYLGKKYRSTLTPREEKILKERGKL